MSTWIVSYCCCIAPAPGSALTVNADPGHSGMCEEAAGVPAADVPGAGLVAAGVIDAVADVRAEARAEAEVTAGDAADPVAALAGVAVVGRAVVGVVSSAMLDVVADRLAAEPVAAESWAGFPLEQAVSRATTAPVAATRAVARPVDDGIS